MDKCATYYNSLSNYDKNFLISVLIVRLIDPMNLYTFLNTYAAFKFYGLVIKNQDNFIRRFGPPEKLQVSVLTEDSLNRLKNNDEHKIWRKNILDNVYELYTEIIKNLYDTNIPFNRNCEQFLKDLFYQLMVVPKDWTEDAKYIVKNYIHYVTNLQLEQIEKNGESITIGTSNNANFIKEQEEIYEQSLFAGDNFFGEFSLEEDGGRRKKSRRKIKSRRKKSNRRKKSRKYF
jgi:hypothetical protein